MAEVSTQRARRREETRQRIEQVALEMFRREGYGSVTVEDVCRVAHVAPATFYRYFACKEDVVFAYRPGFSSALDDAVAGAAGRPCAGGERLAQILTVFTEHLESQSEILALRDEIVLGDRDLVRATLAFQRDIENQLASGLAKLGGLSEPDERARWEAAVGILVLRMALRSWRAGVSDSLSAAVAGGLARLRALLSVAQPGEAGQGPFTQA
jgi:AcrR family transcriptional regulator